MTPQTYELSFVLSVFLVIIAIVCIFLFLNIIGRLLGWIVAMTSRPSSRIETKNEESDTEIAQDGTRSAEEVKKEE